jgi:P27 family predicted phage terminase small subunit
LRPTKPVNMQSGHLTAQEIADRKNAENLLKGGKNNIKPPSYLSKNQKTLFRKIVAELKASDILGNLDVFILTQLSIAIDRLQTIESMINEDPDNLMNEKLMASKNKYSNDLYRCCNELGLSPQSRAKVGNTNLQKKKQDTDPLLMVLRGGKADDKQASGI